MDTDIRKFIIRQHQARVPYYSGSTGSEGVILGETPDYVIISVIKPELIGKEKFERENTRVEIPPPKELAESQNTLRRITKIVAGWDELPWNELLTHVEDLKAERDRIRKHNGRLQTENQALNEKLDQAQELIQQHLSIKPEERALFTGGNAPGGVSAGFGGNSSNAAATGGGGSGGWAESSMKNASGGAAYSVGGGAGEGFSGAAAPEEGAEKKPADKGSKDTERLNWLENESKASKTGVTIEYLPRAFLDEGGWRIMRKHFIGQTGGNLRDAIDMARDELGEFDKGTGKRRIADRTEADNEDD